MLYGQVLRVKHAISTTEYFELFCSELKQKFIKKAYKSDLLDTQTWRVEKLDQNENETLMTRVREKPRQRSLPANLACNCFCSNISKRIWKNYNLVVINASLKEI